MVSQNTVSRTSLTLEDKSALSACDEIGKILTALISGSAPKDEFIKDYTRINFSRDAGQGRGAGKLQRDAICTRGRQAKAPFSNRNLRWNPLVLSQNCPTAFISVEIDVDSTHKKLIFKKNATQKVMPEDIWKESKPLCICATAWEPSKNILRAWNQDDWVANWCGIPIIEYCSVKQAVCSYGILGVITASALFSADLHSAYNKVKSYLKSNNLLVDDYPDEDKSLLDCPLCRSPINGNPAGLQERARPEVWKPPWQHNKRSEGEDSSLQLMHVKPLTEIQINHTPSNVRYGHRWCNVAMTDHGIDQTMEWMNSVIKNWQ